MVVIQGSRPRAEVGPRRVMCQVEAVHPVGHRRPALAENELDGVDVLDVADREADACDDKIEGFVWAEGRYEAVELVEVHLGRHGGMAPCKDDGSEER